MYVSVANAYVSERVRAFIMCMRVCVRVRVCACVQYLIKCVQVISLFLPWRGLIELRGRGEEGLVCMHVHERVMVCVVFISVHTHVHSLYYHGEAL